MTGHEGVANMQTEHQQLYKLDILARAVSGKGCVCSCGWCARHIDIK